MIWRGAPKCREYLWRVPRRPLEGSNSRTFTNWTGPAKGPAPGRGSARAPPPRAWSHGWSRFGLHLLARRVNFYQHVALGPRRGPRARGGGHHGARELQLHHAGPDRHQGHGLLLQGPSGASRGHGGTSGTRWSSGPGGAPTTWAGGQQGRTGGSRPRARTSGQGARGGPAPGPGPGLGTGARPAAPPRARVRHQVALGPPGQAGFDSFDSARGGTRARGTGRTRAGSTSGPRRTGTRWRPTTARTQGPGAGLGTGARPPAPPRRRGHQADRDRLAFLALEPHGGPGAGSRPGGAGTCATLGTVGPGQAPESVGNCRRGGPVKPPPLGRNLRKRG